MEKPFDVMFSSERLIDANGNTFIRYKEKKIIRSLKKEEPGIYKFKFTFLSTNSKFNQAIILHFNDFEGSVEIEGKTQSFRKKEFASLRFFEKEAPKTFVIKIELKVGKLYICNGSDPIGDMKISHSMSKNCAMIEEKINENKIIFHCNDHEFDDDFDDLVFEMEMLSFEPK